MEGTAANVPVVRAHPEGDRVLFELECGHLLTAILAEVASEDMKMPTALRCLVCEAGEEARFAVGVGIAAESRLEETTRDLIPYLRHLPYCDHDEEDRPFEWCLCGLETLLGILRRILGTEIVRCEGCGVYAITPDGTEDWAWREVEVEVEEGTHLIPPREIVPYCHECALALMVQADQERRWWQKWVRLNRWRWRAR